MEIKRVYKNESNSKPTVVELECIEEPVEIPDDSIIIEPERPPYLGMDGYIYAFINGKYRKTGLSLKGPQGDKGDPFKFEDFTELQLLMLKGNEGKPGKDGLFTVDDYEKIVLYFPKYLYELRQTDDYQTVSKEEKVRWNTMAIKFEALKRDILVMKDKLDEVIRLHSSIDAETIIKLAQKIYELTSALEQLQSAYDQLVDGQLDEVDPTVKNWAKIGLDTDPDDVGVLDLEQADIDSIINN